MQRQHLLTADAAPGATGEPTATYAWFPQSIEQPAAPAPSASSLGTSDAGAALADSSSDSGVGGGGSGFATALASFSLRNGKMEWLELVRVQGELLFQGAMTYDRASNVLMVLSTVLDVASDSSTDTSVRDNKFAAYEPANLTLVRALGCVCLE